MSPVDSSHELPQYPRLHACFGTCWCESEPTDAEPEDLSKLPLLEGLQRVAALKRESPWRIGASDAIYRPGQFRA